VSAAGKSILAHLPEQRRAELVEKCDLDAATPSTLTDPVELSRELDRIRDRGYAWSDEEAAVGIRAVGTVLQDRSRSVLGAISVSGPVSRLHGKYYEEDLPERVMEVANVIEITHNYHS
jgi:DNA-binding IclR family transcriptional regulator